MLLSRLLGAPVRDAGGAEIAALRDLVGHWQLGRGLVVAGLVAGIGRRRFFVPWREVSSLGESGAQISSYQVDFREFERREGEILLAGDILDQKLVDVRHRKVVRVNDVVLADGDGSFAVAGVDVGFAALLRRLGPGWLFGGLASTSLLDWSDVEWLPSESYPAGRRSFPQLARLHPVEVAHIVSELPHRQGADIVESLEDEDAAEVLSEVSEEHQTALLKNMDEERAADILEEMEPDDAADLLGKLDPEEAGELLNRMESDGAEDVKALMEYDEGTAGSLMTTHFAAVPRAANVSGAIELLRQLQDRPKTITHLLVVEGDERERFVGIVPLLDLVLAPPTERLDSLIAEEAPIVAPETPISEVARRMAEYDLAVMPVVGEDGELLGVVAVDDMVEEMLPERWRRRLPRLFG